MDLSDLSLDSLKGRAREWAEAQARYRCIMCGYVGRLPDFYDGSVKCPNCGDNGRYRQVFPVNVNYAPLLQSIHVLSHVPDENVRSMVINLFVTAYELWFEELFSYFLLNTGVSHDLTDFIIDEARSFERKKRLFSTLAHASFDYAVERVGETGNVDRVEYFVRLRNIIIHQGELKIEPHKLDECVMLIERLPVVFRKLNNEFFLWKKGK